MANTHILTQTGNNLQVVLHIAVPAGNNSVGVSWATAVVNSGVFGRPPASILPTGTAAGQITAAELASLQAGTLIEVVDSYAPNAAEIAGANAYLDAMYTLRSGQWLTFYQAVLKFFGYTR